MIWILSGILILDVAATLCILSGRSRRIRQWQGVDSWLTGVSSRLERRIYGWVDRRIQNAYPEAAYRRELQAEAEQRKTVFAYGLCFYKIALLLVVGAFLGDIVETIFCRLTAGIWMSREQFCLGPVQYRLGSGSRGGDDAFVPLPEIFGPLSVLYGHIFRRRV